MKLAFTKYLIFSILMFGTVIPVHAYVHFLERGPAEQHQLTADTNNQSDVHTASCDHCCHFSAHATGMHPSNHGDQRLAQGSNSLNLYSIYHSLTAAPPYHPPILS